MGSSGGRFGVGVAGAAIGFHFGGPVGAALGYTIGGFIGGILFGERQVITGPRAEPRAPNARVYGESIPFTYGSVRLVGTPIWSAGIEERFTTEEQGKKGGVKSKKKPITVTFFTVATFAIAFCEGEIKGIRRLWFNGKLVFDGREGSEVTRRPSLQMKIYRGTQDQNPDPDIEDKEGAGEVSAHRGICYIVFKEVILTDFGNTFPVVEAEIITDGSLIDDVVEMFVVGESQIGGNKFAMFPTEPYVYNYTSTKIDKYSVLRNVPIAGADVGTMPKSQFPGKFTGIGATTWSLGQLELAPEGTLWGLFSWFESGTGFSMLAQLDPDTMAYINVTEVINALSPITLNVHHPRVIWLGWTFFSRALAVSKGLLTFLLEPLALEPFFDLDPNTIRIDTARIPFGGGIIAPSMEGMAVDRNGDGWFIFNGNVVAPNQTPTNPLFRVDMRTGDIQEMKDLKDDDTAMYATQGIRYDLLNDVFLIMGSNIDGSGGDAIVTLDRTSLTVLARRTDITLGGKNSNHEVGDNPILVGRTWINVRGMTDPETGEFAISGMAEIEVLTLNVLRFEFNFQGQETTGRDLFGRFDWWTNGAITTAVLDKSADLGASVLHWFFDRLDPEQPLLSSVVADLMRRAGYEQSDYDVTSLSTTNVRGYPVGHRASVRAMIEPLILAYHFDATESDFKVKFVKRGVTPSETIPWEDLGARTGEDFVTRLSEVRLSELDTPLQIELRYLDFERDYEQGNQQARRIHETDALNGAGTSEATATRTIDVPVVMLAGEARDLAWRILFQAWFERIQFKITLPPKWLKLDPTDVINVETIPNDPDPQAIRIFKTDLGNPPVIRIEATLDDAEIYGFKDVSATSGGEGFVDQVITLPAPVVAIIMDVPAPDDDNTDIIGLFFAMGADETGTFNGGMVWESRDAGETYTVAKLTGFRSLIGTVETVLSPPLRDEWTITDEVNTLDVRLLNSGDILETVVNDTVLWNGGNTALVGNEIIQFRTATQLSLRRWRLSGLLRGRRGTENEIGGHSAGDRFVLFDLPPVLFDENLLADLDTVMLYRGTPIGAPPIIGRQTNLLYKANNVRTWGPAYVTGTRGLPSTDDWTIDWVRRSRQFTRWPSAITGPLDEATEEYEIDVLDAPGGNVVDTKLISDADTFVYTEAAQITDFSVAQSVLHLVVYQIGVVGRSFPTAVTITED